MSERFFDQKEKMDNLKIIRQYNLLYALHEMGDRNDVIVDTHGNASIRDEDFMWIKPSGMKYKMIGVSDLCALDFDLNVPEFRTTNQRTPSVDSVHHAAIYLRHPNIGAICHTHSPYVVSYAARDCSIECYTTEHADYFGRKIRCLDYADLSCWGKYVTVSKDERAILLGSHGALTFADDACKAVELAIALELIAMKAYLIEAANKFTSPMLELEIDKWHSRYVNSYGQK